MGLPLQANALPALASAGLWGGADFSGGMGVNRAGGSLRSALRIVMISHASSLTVLVLAASILGYHFPHGTVLLWGLSGGLVGGFSLTAFYMALARGGMGISAAISGLLAAAIPAGISMALDGSPGMLRLAGFVIAGVAIWMIAAPPTEKHPSAAGPKVQTDRGTMLLAIGAGVGFGLYFFALKMAGPAGVVWTMATARMGSLSTSTLLLLIVTVAKTGGQSKITRPAVLWAISTALLDTIGNMLFVFATQHGRLDVASVLASLYPASTILLAAWLLHEHPTRRQALGMGIAVIAVAMISL